MQWALSIVAVAGFATEVAAECDVTVARAPEAVRDEIHRWVRAEARCATPLEVRVVATEGGYYLFARDPFGNVRERIVPDAQSAGVLVASWVADESEPVVVPPPGPEIVILPPIAVRLDVDRRRDTGSTDRRDTRNTTRWLTLGAMMKAEDGGGTGIRAEIDVTSFGAWSLGFAVAGAKTHAEALVLDPELWSWGYMTIRDARLVATLARTKRFGAWEVRLAGGVGVVHTSISGTLLSTPGGQFSAAEMFPTAEASIQLSRRLGRHWAIGAGPLVSWYAQEFDADLVDESVVGSPMPMSVPLGREDYELMLFAGLRHEI